MIENDRMNANNLTSVFDRLENFDAVYISVTASYYPMITTAMVSGKSECRFSRY